MLLTPFNPVEIIKIPVSKPLDIKTYQNYAYVVVDFADDMAIIDLSGLPCTANLVGYFKTG